MRPSRLDSLLLAGVGTLAVHELAYLPKTLGSALGDPSMSHGHLPALWGVATLVAVVAFGRAITGSLRSRADRPRIDPMVLSASIGAFYFSQESLERALSGSPSIGLLGEAVLWLGLLAAPLVGWTLSRLVNHVVDLVTRPANPRPGVGAISPLMAATPIAAPLDIVQLLHVLTRRGPPVRTS